VLLLLLRDVVCAGDNVVLYCLWLLLQLLRCLRMQCLLLLLQQRLLLLLRWQQHVWVHMLTQGCLRQVC
jgi:hypothetical protein